MIHSLRARATSVAILAMTSMPIAQATCPRAEFDEPLDSATWIQCGDWNERQEPIWEQTDGQYCLGFSHPVREPPPPPISVEAQWTVTATTDTPSDGCVYAGIETGTEAAGNWSTNFAVAIRADCRGSGYKALIGPALGRLSIYRRLAMLGDEAGFAFKPATRYQVEFCATGTDLELRYWEVGAPRPAKPMLAATDKQFARGNIGVGVFLENQNFGPNFRGCFTDLEYRAAGRCVADVDCSGAVDMADLAAVWRRWGDDVACAPSVAEDLNGDCEIGWSDAWQLISEWGRCSR